jgi:HK97 family phage portal protein
MALLARTAGALTRVFRPPQRKALAGRSATYIPPSWPWNFWQLGYDPLRVGGGAIVAACIDTYAQTAAECPPSHWRSTGDGGRERITTSALSRVMLKPNSYQSGSDFILNLVGYLYGDGNAYALAIRNNRFEVAELHLMDAASSGANVASNGQIFYNLGGNPVVEAVLPREALSQVPARDVLHLKLNARGNPLKGDPPLINAIADVAAGHAMLQSAHTIAQNKSQPSGVLTTDQPLEDWQNKEIHQMWLERTTGAGAGGVPILSSGLKFQQISITSRDAQAAEIMQITDGHIATVYRIPLPLLSLWGVQGQGGATEDLIRSWVASAFGFSLNHIECGIGQFFGLAGYPQEYLEFDTAALLRSAQRDRIEALARGVQGGIYSPNEARALEDLPAAKEGDSPRVQQQVVPLDAWSQPPPSTPRPDAPAAAPPANQNDPAATEAAAKAGIAAIRRGYAGTA